MEYRSKYKAEEIEAILDAKNNDGAGVDANLDGLFTDALQTKEVEVSEDTTITADEGFLGLKEVSVKVNGGGSGGSNIKYFKHNGEEMGKGMVAEMGVMAGQTIKWKDTDDTIRFEHGNSFARNVDVTSFQTSQRYIGALAMSLIDAPINIYINSAWMEQNFVEYISDVVEAGALIEITEEEFYTL